ncbi:MAG: hypothetical protein AAB538_02520 [Patescibacteria group bacterium]
MRKTPFILAAGAIAALILGGVIEIRFHGEKLADVPKGIAAAAQDGSMYEKIRARAVGTKRVAERLIIKDDKQRLEIALRYVEEDSARLRRLSEEGNGPEKLAAQVGLLEDSLSRVREQSQAVSIEDLRAFKDKAQASLALAREAVEISDQVKEHFETLKNRLAEVRESIENQVGRLESAEDSGDVAATVTPSPEPSIPLKF